MHINLFHTHRHKNTILPTFISRLPTHTIVSEFFLLLLSFNICKSYLFTGNDNGALSSRGRNNGNILYSSVFHVTLMIILYFVTWQEHPFYVKSCYFVHDAGGLKILGNTHLTSFDQRRYSWRLPDHATNMVNIKNVNKMLNFLMEY